MEYEAFKYLIYFQNVFTNKAWFLRAGEHDLLGLQNVKKLKENIPKCRFQSIFVIHQKEKKKSKSNVGVFHCIEICVRISNQSRRQQVKFFFIF